MRDQPSFENFIRLNHRDPVAEASGKTKKLFRATLDASSPPPPTPGQTELFRETERSFPESEWREGRDYAADEISSENKLDE